MTLEQAIFALWYAGLGFALGVLMTLEIMRRRGKL